MFDARHLVKHPRITVSNLRGYVLPHASTQFTGHIISHTLRFVPAKKPKSILLLYLPSSPSSKHEWMVPMLSLRYFLGKQAVITLLDASRVVDIDPSRSFDLVVVSADFVHYMNHGVAVELENRAAMAVTLRSVTKVHPRIRAGIDDARTFELLDRIIPDSQTLQWVGRSRSPGEKAVGYLSFLIRDEDVRVPPASTDWVFVSVVDSQMQTRECLGRRGPLTDEAYESFVRDVLHAARTTSRLTSGRDLDVPLAGIITTTLTRETNPNTRFIRGWHAVETDALFLPTVMLENTMENGHWLDATVREWSIPGQDYDMTETIQKLSDKAKKPWSPTTPVRLYTSRIQVRTLE